MKGTIEFEEILLLLFTTITTIATTNVWIYFSIESISSSELNHL